MIRRALARRVRALTRDPADPAAGTWSNCWSILEQLGQAVPFEVQSVFYRVWQAGAAEDPGMAELARRLGFATGRATI